jgi:hypothetical protein
MKIKPWLIDLFEAEYFVLLLGFVVFTISYHVLTRGDWRRTVAGRLLMALGASCSVILGLSVLRIFAPERPWRIYATALALGGLVFVVIWLNVLMFARQLARRKDQAEREKQRL